MATISLKYNANNPIAVKTIEYILSLGVFETVDAPSVAKKKTLKAIDDARHKRNVTECNTFEEYLKAVLE